MRLLPLLVGWRLNAKMLIKGLTRKVDKFIHDVVHRIGGQGVSWLLIVNAANDAVCGSTGSTIDCNIAWDRRVGFDRVIQDLHSRV